eukprot:4029870-Pleurochrysis_carterae.AAC.2
MRSRELLSLCLKYCQSEALRSCTPLCDEVATRLHLVRERAGFIGAFGASGERFGLFVAH